MIKRCHDCGVKIGEQHKPGCDWEECPFCRRQLLSCDCIYEKLNIDGDDDPTDEQIEQFEILLKEKGYVLYGNETRFPK